MTIIEAFELYRLNCIVFRNQSRKTEENHICAMKALTRFTGNIELESLTFDLVRQWKSNLESKSMAPNTIRGYILKLRVVLKYMQTIGNPCLNVDLIPPPQRRSKKTSFLTPEEVKKLIDACEIPGSKHINRLRNKAIVALLFSSGIRVSELCRLSREDVKQDYFSVIGKGDVLAPSFVDATARRYIDLYLDIRKDDGQALFVSDQKGYPRMIPGNVQEVFKTLRKHTGIQASPHTMRHSFATDLMRNGADIRYVQVMMHHKNIQTTAQYLHVVDEEMHSLHTRYHTAVT